MTSGVPQGSVLGPLLFVAHINDIDANLRNVRVLKYADDIKLYLEVKRTDPMRYRSFLQSDLDTMQQWISDWQFKLAVGKCVARHFGRKKPAFTYSLSNTNLKKSSSGRDLGIIVNNDLRWINCISKIVKKAEEVLSPLSKTFVSRCPAIYLKLYTKMVRPHLEFASPVWNLSI
eukprot:XP_014772054.1 PREDICTED: RNA-directed DNA polymerase from mobile element jockey-like [Octopus bimaculoides]